MHDWNLENIRLILGEPSDDVRFGLRSALNGAGFKQIEDTGRVSGIRDAIAGAGADLLVCAMNLADGDFDDLIHQIRHQEIGNNPFVTIITLIPMADEPMIKKAMSSGTDDIMVMPVSPDNLMKRVGHLISERKPFVVTTDYIGPDRRTGHRPGSQKIPIIKVPNPLREIVEDEPDLEKLRKQIVATASQLNDQKIERHAYQIVYLVDKIAADGNGNGNGDGEAADGESIADHLARLGRVCDDINNRLYGSAFAHWGEACQSLARVMKHVRGAGMKASETDLFALVNLADQLRDGIAEQARTAQIA